MYIGLVDGTQCVEALVVVGVGDAVVGAAGDSQLRMLQKQPVHVHTAEGCLHRHSSEAAHPSAAEKTRPSSAWHTKPALQSEANWQYSPQEYTDAVVGDAVVGDAVVGDALGSSPEPDPISAGPEPLTEPWSRKRRFWGMAVIA